MISDVKFNPEYWDSEDNIPSWGYYADGTLYDMLSESESKTIIRNVDDWSHSTAAYYLLRKKPAWRRRMRMHYQELIPGEQYDFADGPSLIMLFESAIPAARYLYRNSILELTISTTALNDRVVSSVVRNLARAWGNLSSRFLIESVALDIDSGCKADSIAPTHFFGEYDNPTAISRIIASVRGAETVEELNRILEPWRGK